MIINGNYKFIDMESLKPKFIKAFTRYYGDLYASDIADKIKQYSKSVVCTDIFPVKIKENGVSSFLEQCQRIKKQTEKSGEQFILAYWPEPDHTCHYEGTYVDISQKTIRMMNSEIKRMARELKDTLLIISADHGHIPVENILYINDIPGFVDCLEIPLNLDDRVTGIFLKKGKEKTFLKLYDQFLKSNFILLKQQDVLDKNLFGHGAINDKISDFIGDYLLIAVSNTILRQYVQNSVSGPEMKSSHSGLTKKEMIVPLILVEK